MVVRFCHPFLVSGVVLLFYMVAASPLNKAIFFSCLTVFLLFVIRRRIFNVVMKRTYAVTPLGSLLRRQALFSREMFMFMKMTKMNIIKGTRWRRRRKTPRAYLSLPIELPNTWQNQTSKRTPMLWPIEACCWRRRATLRAYPSSPMKRRFTW